MTKPSLGQIADLHNQIEAGRVTRDNLQFFLRNPEGSALIFGDYPTFSVTVDYDISLEKMAMATAFEDIADVVGLDQFEMRGEGRVDRELTICSICESVTTKVLLAEIDKHGFRPAKVEDLLSFLGQFRRFRMKTGGTQGGAWLVALGSYCSWAAGHCIGFPSLREWRSDKVKRRSLSLAQPHSKKNFWLPEHSFLVARKDAV